MRLTGPSLSGLAFGGTRSAANRKPNTSQGHGKGQALVALNARRAAERLEEHRAAIEDGVEVPTLVIQKTSVRLNVRGACRFCGGTIFNQNIPGTNPDNPQRVRGEISCGMCGRTVCHLEIGPPPRPKPTAEQMQARRGRPPGSRNGALS